MPRVDVNGLGMAYEIGGAGPPLVLLHGLAQRFGGSHVVHRVAFPPQPARVMPHGGEKHRDAGRMAGFCLRFGS